MKRILLFLVAAAITFTSSATTLTYSGNTSISAQSGAVTDTLYLNNIHLVGAGLQVVCVKVNMYLSITGSASGATTGMSFCLSPGATVSGSTTGLSVNLNCTSCTATPLLIVLKYFKLEHNSISWELIQATDLITMVLEHTTDLNHWEVVQSYSIQENYTYSNVYNGYYRLHWVDNEGSHYSPIVRVTDNTQEEVEIYTIQGKYLGKTVLDKFKLNKGCIYFIHKIGTQDYSKIQVH